MRDRGRCSPSDCDSEQPDCRARRRVTRACLLLRAGVLGSVGEMGHATSRRRGLIECRRTVERPYPGDDVRASHTGRDRRSVRRSPSPIRGCPLVVPLAVIAMTLRWTQSTRHVPSKVPDQVSTSPRCRPTCPGCTPRRLSIADSGSPCGSSACRLPMEGLTGHARLVRTSSARDVKIVRWRSIEGQFLDNRSALLLGNGFSSNIWSMFRYHTLLGESALDGQAKELFGSGSNFETVLARLAVAQEIVAVVEPRNRGLLDQLNRLVKEVRDGLLGAVQNVHPESWNLIAGQHPVPGTSYEAGFPRFVMETIKTYLPKYARVFTTNYDLISYWASVPGVMADLFPGAGPFDVDKAEDWLSNSPMPKIFYLHGALHLWSSMRSNAEGKHTTGQGASLLEIVRSGMASPDHVPLFISEGSSLDKVARISASPYLSFCARTLASTDAPLTVLGQSLDDVDHHIRLGIQRHPARPVAVGIWVGDVSGPDNKSEALETRATELRGRLPECRDVVFFDVAEHRLTDPGLNCG